MKFHKQKLTREIFINEEGQIDLASIVVGIIVIGLIGGIIAASLFAIIPWANDNAAKNQLDSVTTAEQAAKAKDSAYQNTALLAANKYLPNVKDLVVSTDQTGSCYVAVIKSGSGKLYWKSDKVKVQEYVPGSSSANSETCTSVSTIADGLTGNNQASGPVGNDPTDVDHDNSLFTTLGVTAGDLATQTAVYDNSYLNNGISITVPHTGYDLYDISKMHISPYLNKVDGTPYGVTGTVSFYTSGTEGTLFTQKAGTLLVDNQEVGSFGQISYNTLIKDNNPKVSSDGLSVSNIRFNTSMTLPKYAKLFDGTSKIKIGNNVWTIPKSTDYLAQYDASGYTAGSHSYTTNTEIDIATSNNRTILTGIVGDYKPSDITGTSLDFFINKVSLVSFSTKADFYYSSTGNDADFVKVGSTPENATQPTGNPAIRIGNNIAGYMVRLDGGPVPLATQVQPGGKWKIVATLSNGDTYSFTGKASAVSQYN